MKIGKNNFKPPPAVESSVVRLVPKRPRPQISWEEWDGMLRIAFVRKNRTLRASFLGTSTVLELLEGNWRTWCAVNGVEVEEGEGAEGMDVEEGRQEVDDEVEEEEEEWGGFMDVDEEEEDVPELLKEGNDGLLGTNRAGAGKGGKRKRKGRVAELVREKVRKVLEDETGLADRRAGKCDEGDFLRLLWAMNKEGIHFS